MTSDNNNYVNKLFDMVIFTYELTPYSISSKPSTSPFLYTKRKLICSLRINGAFFQADVSSLNFVEYGTSTANRSFELYSSIFKICNSY